MKKTVLFIILGMSLVLTACGKSAASPSTKLEVTMTDFQFTPNQFTVQAGKEITLNATNSGAVIHNFVIMQKGQSVGTEFTDEDLANVYWQVELAAGGSVNTSFIAPSDLGDYEVVCKTPGHVQAGMIAKLTVVANQ